MPHRVGSNRDVPGTPDPTARAIAAKLKQALAEQGLIQAELVARANTYISRLPGGRTFEMDRRYLSAILAGRFQPSWHALDKILQALGKSWHWLFDWPEAPTDLSPDEAALVKIYREIQTESCRRVIWEQVHAQARVDREIQAQLGALRLVEPR